MTVVDSLSVTRADAIEQLRKAASAYVEIYGHPQGLYEFGEDLCRIVAKDYDDTGRSRVAAPGAEASGLLSLLAPFQLQFQFAS